MKPKTIRLPFFAPSTATLERWLGRFLRHPVPLDSDPGAGDNLASYRLNPEWIERGMQLAGEQEASSFLRRLIHTGRRGGLEQRFETQRQEARRASSPPRLDPRRGQPRQASVPATHPRPLVEAELARLHRDLSDLGRSMNPNPEHRARIEAQIAELERKAKCNEP